MKDGVLYKNREKCYVAVQHIIIYSLIHDLSKNKKNCVCMSSVLTWLKCIIYVKKHCTQSENMFVMFTKEDNE